MRRLAALVLAAGQSRRMGEARNKLLEPVGGKPLVAHPVDVLVEAGLTEILVITGFEAERIESALADRPVECWRHADWQRGMASSVSAGIRRLTGGPSDPLGVFVVLGDLPRLRSADVRQLSEAFQAEGDASKAESAIVVPVAEGRRGHPVLFGCAHFEALQILPGPKPGGEDRGARSLLEARPECVRTVEVGHEGPLVDVDTPADLARAQQLADAPIANESRPPFSETPRRPARPR